MKLTHPCPILTRLRYNFVGSASVQIAFNLAITSNDSFGFSRLLGVAVPGVALLAFLDKALVAGLFAGPREGWDDCKLGFENGCC